MPKPKKKTKDTTRTAYLRMLTKHADKGLERERKAHADAVEQLRRFADVFGAHGCFDVSGFVGDADVKTCQPRLDLESTSRQIYELTPRGFVGDQHPDSEPPCLEYFPYEDLAAVQLLDVLAKLCVLVEHVGVNGGGYDENEHDPEEDDPEVE